MVYELARVVCRSNGLAWLVAAFAFASCDISGMKPRDVLVGHVQDAAGDPIAGVKVVEVDSVRERDGNQVTSWSVQGNSEVSDVHGDFTLHVLAPLGPGEQAGMECTLLTLSHPDYADRRVLRTDIGLYELNPVVTLQISSTIDVLVERRGERAELTVTASIQPFRSPGLGEWSARRILAKGSNTCQFKNAPAGVIYLQVTRRVSDDSPFGNTATLSEQQTVTIEPGEVRAIEFHLNETGELSGAFRATSFGDSLVLRVLLLSGAAKAELNPPILAQWSGNNGQRFSMPNLTEPGEKFFLRVYAIVESPYDLPLPESTERDLDIGTIEIR